MGLMAPFATASMDHALTFIPKEELKGTKYEYLLPYIEDYEKKAVTNKPLYIKIAI